MKKFPRPPRWLIIAFVLSWFVPRPIYLAVGSLDITPQKVVSVVLVFYVFSRGLYRWEWIDAWVLLPFFSNLICLGASAGLARGIESTGQLFLDLWSAYIAGRIIAAHPPTLTWFVRWVAKCLACLVPLLLLESVFRINIHSILWRVPYLPHHEMRLGLTRAHGWTAHAIMLGLTYAAFVAPMTTLALQRGKRSFYDWCTVVLLLGGVFFSLSTGGWNAACVALLLLLWDRKAMGSRRSKWRFAAIAFLALYLGLEIMADAPPLLVLMYHANFLSSGWLYRWQLWERVLSVMPGHWWIGYGGVTPREFSGISWSIDNHYLVVLLQQGWLGLGSWLGACTIVLWRNIKQSWISRKDDLHRQVLRSYGFTVIGFLASALTVAIFSTAAVMLFLSLGIAATNVHSAAMRK